MAHEMAIMAHEMSAAATAAAASPVKSEIFSGVALLAVSLIVVLILRHYLPLRTTPAYLLVPVFFALLLPASMVLLVPIDLASSAMVDDLNARGVWLEPGALRVAWRITYWLTFALTWFLLPILGEYSDSGFHEPKDKILDSLRANAQYYAIVFGSALPVLVYIFFSDGQFSESLKSTAMALAYCWGLVLAIYLMGHGLVTIPRRLLRNASISGRLRRIQSQAPRVYEQMEEAEIRLEDIEGHVFELTRKASAGTGNARQFRDWVEDLADMTNLPESQLSSLSFASRRQRAVVAGSRDPDDCVMAIPTVITEKYLADLTRHLLQARHARARYVDEWNRLLTDAVETQAVLDSAASKRLDFGRATVQAGLWDRVTVLNPYTRHLLHFRVIPVVRIILGLLLAVASVCIVWSELVKAVFPTLSVIRYSVVHNWVRAPAPGSGPGEPGHHNGDTHHGHGNDTTPNNGTMYESNPGAHTVVVEMKGQVGFAGQFIAALWMCYMSAAALVSITEVKVWRGRALVRRNTAPESAFWYASQVARLSVPLTYNFMTFLGTSTYRDTVFYAFLGQLINLTPLGGWFDLLFPAFILVPVCATLFGLYGKVKRAIGLAGVDIIDDEDAGGDGAGGQASGTGYYGLGSWREGRALIERELNGSSATIRRTRAAASTLPSTGGPGAGGRAAPILTIPQPSNPSSLRGSTAPRYGGPTTPLGTSPGARPVANTSARRAAATSRPSRGGLFAGDVDDEDENFFESLGNRVKNTIETIEPPQWLQDIGNNIRKLGGSGSGREGRIRL